MMASFTSILFEDKFNERKKKQKEKNAISINQGQFLYQNDVTKVYIYRLYAVDTCCEQIDKIRSFLLDEKDNYLNRIFFINKFKMNFRG